ncbi:MAG: Ig domain-containing protein [Bacteroidales bacterium]|nr:Ig domain-containing protein [Candidatus Colicola caccequi]
MKKVIMSVCAAMMCCTMALGAKYKAVTSIDQIKAGDVVIFVCESESKANGGFEKTTTTKNTYLLEVDVTITGDSIETEAATEFTLGKSGSDWTFTTGTSTLSKKKVDDDKMAINKSTDKHSITVGGAATIVKNLDGGEYTIRYNQGKFRYYKPSTTVPNNVKLYRRTQAGTDPVYVESVSLSKTSATLAVDEQLTLTATILPENADNKDVTWKSDKESVATVTNGVVTAIAAGTATITVTTVDGAKTATCAVTVTSEAVATTMYRLSDKAKQLVDGAYVSFCSMEDVSVVMGTYVSGNNIKQMSATDNEDGTISVTSKGLYTVHVSGDTYAFEDSEGNYIYAAGGSSNNYLKARTEAEYWTIAIDAEGDLVQSTANANRGVMRYNESYSMFSCYQTSGSVQPLVVFSSVPAGQGTGEIDVVKGKSEEVRTYKVMRNGRIEIESRGRRYSILGEKL